MPAPEPRFVDRRCGLVGLLALVACASNMPEPVQRTEAPQSAPPAEAPAFAAPVGDATAIHLDELEASLAAYEQQLASNEARLQAMGVRIAQRSLGGAEKAEDAKKDSRADADDRFAAPPPAAPTTAPSTKPGDAAPPRDERQAKAKKTPTAASRKNNQAPAPRPQGGASGRAAGSGYGGVPAEARAEEADKERGDRCGELCDLASSTCELEAKICELAARHAGEPRYDAVCQRADDDCRLASDACNRCSP